MLKASITLAFAVVLTSISFGTFAEEAKKDSKDADPMICATERVTGSTIPRRVCMRASERAALRAASQQALSASQRKTPTVGGGQ